MAVLSIAAWLSFSEERLKLAITRQTWFDDGIAYAIRSPENINLLSPAYFPDDLVSSLLLMKRPAVLVTEDSIRFFTEQRSKIKSARIAVAYGTSLPGGSIHAGLQNCLFLGSTQQRGFDESPDNTLRFESGAGCSLAKLPAGWAVISAQIPGVVLVIPEDLSADVLDRFWRSRVTSGYISVREGDIPLNVGKSGFVTENLTTVDEDGRKQVDKLRGAIDWFLWAGGLVGVVSFTILIHGQQKLLRREIGLLASMGAEMSWIRRWLRFDIFIAWLVVFVFPTLLVSLTVLCIEGDSNLLAFMLRFSSALVLTSLSTCVAISYLQFHALKKSDLWALLKEF